jgi:hypothetical protein
MGVEIPLDGKEKFLTKKAFMKRKFFKKDLQLDFEARSVGFRCVEPDVRRKPWKGWLEL